MLRNSAENFMSMEIVMPKTGLTNTENTLGSWMVLEGDHVKKGQVLAEIESEKTTMPFESLGDGIIHRIAKEGDTIAVGGIIAFLAANEKEYKEVSSQAAAPSEKAKAVTDTFAAVPAAPAAPVVSVTGGRVIASPLARKKAEKAGIDLSQLQGTGPKGRIVAKDVDAFANLKPAASSPKVQGSREPVRIPLTSIRKAIARNMYNSLRSMAQTSDSVELDVTELVKMRKKLVARADDLGTKITINDLLSYAAVKMLKTHPLANAVFTEEEIITYPYVNLSFAVATDYGLTSPVIRDADLMSVVELSKAMKVLVEKARERKLTADEQRDGTFTLTNMGVFPVDSFNPIINAPQSAIIGFGRCVEKPAVYQGEIAIRTMMSLSITYDHRVFDGGEVGSIMRTMKDYLENPELFLVQ
jgi:pyruvate dehydrogenase complex dihydrolipoamide acetyltransferase long form